MQGRESLETLVVDIEQLYCEASQGNKDLDSLLMLCVQTCHKFTEFQAHLQARQLSVQVVSRLTADEFQIHPFPIETVEQTDL